MKTHPLSDHTRDVLRRLERSGPAPAQDFNPGVVDRLKRGRLVDMIALPSPYKTVKGHVWHLRINDAGRAEIVPQGS